MVEIAPGWESDVDRGPDWLFVKLKPQGFGAADTPQLAEPLWKLLEQHSLHRLVLELDNIEVLFSHLIGQLVLLHKRIAVQGGTMRLCGLSPQNQEVLRICRLDDRFLPFRNREEAVTGHRSAGNDG